ncbi:hypothetical protein ACKWTF_014411 [Chironomus riparius]
MKVLGFRQVNKLGFCLKIFFIISFIVLVLNIYSSTNSSAVFKKFRDENLQLQAFQDKFANLMQRGVPQMQEAKFVDDLSEKERAKLLGLDDGITDEARRIIKELNFTNPGENGEPVIIPESASEDIKKLNQSYYEKYLYNGLASSLISLNRALPDKRDDYCKNKKYPEDLPVASIVIPFHDDDWMLLMRCIHSVMLRTPDHLYNEILLSYDLSDREYYHEELNKYIKKYPKIRIVRSPKRQGIILTRIMGARNAIGPVIVMVDSHCEVTPGWLEPILARIKEAPNLIAWAKTTGISPDTLEPHLGPDPGALGTFRWDMGFDWMDIKWYEGDKPTPTFEPKPTLTFIGPCFAVRKDYFHHIGLFDPEYDIWGGEDVELSFRAWMCGGRVEMIPCAVAAHMFKSHTYSHNSKGKGGARFNTDRIAEIWLDDEYKKYYYNAMGHTKDRYYGDITERMELKKKLGCKSFKWFLETLHPKMPLPEHVRDFDDEERQKAEQKRKAEEEQRQKAEEEQKKKNEEEQKRKQEEIRLKDEEEQRRNKVEEQRKLDADKLQKKD